MGRRGRISLKNQWKIIEITSRDFDNDYEISMKNRYQINEMSKTGKGTQGSNFDEKPLLNQRNGENDKYTGRGGFR
jgi:hypothetical protein